MSDPRPGFQGLWNVIRFNWPYYLFAGLAIAAGAFLARTILAPAAAVVWAGVFLASFWMLASLLATLYVYDISELYQWRWMEELLGAAPEAWANFHAGLDESSEAMRALWPSSTGRVIDIFDARKMTEASIERARDTSFGKSDAAMRDGVVPIESSALDAAFAIFSAHELREEAERADFFRELARVVKAEGRLVVVEHLRDIRNFVAYGPAFRHFFTRGQWLRVAADAGFSVQTEKKIAGLVHCFVFRRGPK
jgi:SAM-dependent methyltransferase